MKDDLTPLPEKFAYLEPFALAWGGLERASERYLQRQNSSMEELVAFHKAAAPHLDEIFSYLDGFPPGDLPAPEARLLRTVSGLAEVMQAVEVFGQPRMKNAPYPHILEIEWNDQAAA
jgi:hypothetical protein